MRSDRPRGHLTSRRSGEDDMAEDDEQLEPQTLLRSEVEDIKERSRHLRGTIK